MSLLCCWSKSDDAFDDNRNEQDVGDRDGSKGRPSKRAMAVDPLLSALAIAEVIPIPVVNVIVQAAIRLIEMCRAEELSKRIKALSLVMVGGLSEKRAEDISEALRSDIEQLQRDCMKYPGSIVSLPSFSEGHMKLSTNAFQGWRAPWLILSDIVLKELEISIRAQNKKVDATWKNTEDIKAMPHVRFYTRVQTGSQVISKTTFPTSFQCETSSTAKGNALLVPGGMGKTSAGLAIMEHNAVVTRFGESNRLWTPCVKAESVSLLLDTLYDYLRVTRKTGSTLEYILSELEPPSGKLHSQPFRVLLLDNFETPRNLNGQEHIEVEQILRSLMRIPYVTILITMRGNQIPVEGWEKEWISPLDLSASMQIYKETHVGTSEEGLSELLDAVGHLPLAVTLIAKYAETNGATPAELLAAWRLEGTAMLTMGDDDADNMINRSIRLSIDSPRMKRSPDSLKLLSLLALFPAGLAAGMVREWIPPSLNSLKALSVLNGAALAEQREDNVRVIPVIRSYVLHPSHTPITAVREHVRQICCSLLVQHKSGFGDPTFPSDKSFISSQEVNFQSILLDANFHTDFGSSGVAPEILEAPLTLSRHQFNTRRRRELIQRTLNVTERAKNEKYVAKALACYGDICLVLDQYADAIEKLELAHDKFLSLGSTASAGRCTLKIVECKTFKDVSFEENLALTRRVQPEFEKDDIFGQAVSSVEMWSSPEHTETVCTKSKRHPPSPNPNTTKSLHKALLLGIEAAELFAKCDFGEYVAANLSTMSEILKDMRSYDEALGKGLQALETFKSLGSPTYVANGLRRCGEILFEMGDYEAAKDALEKSLVSLEALDDSHHKRYVTAKCEALLDVPKTKLKDGEGLKPVMLGAVGREASPREIVPS
ncbi:hypothetical protein GYMLUDRAFT_997598 [Collybiopsis luxurians FD-317 M1]|uniref:NB-ARC domain-containing protein n=1 Tax=Collybiopsis luxurians FD-317 M1 TaxID=944289 RepID=A0A0D0CER6_9AGAR|nr:hypothetical protein GYMLUDRAFT_997598 [Collybiopsis luxurians FD-317 M1]